MSNTNGQSFLAYELEWLEGVISTRLESYLNDSIPSRDIYEITPPGTTGIHSKYAQFALENNLSFEERFILILALAPHIRPNFFDSVFNKHLSGKGDFPELGGVRGKNFRGFLPTGESVLFLLAGSDLDKRFAIQALFDIEHIFHTKQVLRLTDNNESEPLMSCRIVLHEEYVELFTREKITTPRLSSSFPAQLITTEMEWNDLILNESTQAQIKEIENWVKYNHVLFSDWGMKAKLKPGYKCLFHGQPGTGKTLTATLLGKYTKRNVFRVDLSTVISKFIGETEQNLSLLFDKAESKDWILFFDECDALFGKRTSVRDAHDKYANQEVSYLLQRIENHAGLVILASNFKSNIDEAFTRRFQSMIYFPMPNANERLLLWQKTFPKALKRSRNVDLKSIARNYELSGASIVNIVQFICLQALASDSESVRQEDIVVGIKKEFTKEGKLFQN